MITTMLEGLALHRQMANDTGIAPLCRLLIDSHAQREPDLYIGGRESPYMRRWHILRDADHGCIYLHNILRDDDDRALHDHPWDSITLVLHGRLREITSDGRRMLEPGSITRRPAEQAHRLELFDASCPVWTLFFTGPRRREWGFHCPQGWRHWRDFVSQDDHGQPGRGCD